MALLGKRFSPIGSMVGFWWWGEGAHIKMKAWWIQYRNIHALENTNLAEICNIKVVLGMSPLTRNSKLCRWDTLLSKGWAGVEQGSGTWSSCIKLQLAHSSLWASVSWDGGNKMFCTWMLSTGPEDPGQLGRLHYIGVESCLQVEQLLEGLYSSTFCHQW